MNCFIKLFTPKGWCHQTMGAPIIGDFNIWLHQELVEKSYIKSKLCHIPSVIKMMGIYLLGFFRGLSQYGLLHLGHTFGFSFVFVIHLCPHRSHSHLKTMASSILIVKRINFLLYKDYLKYIIQGKVLYTSNYIP